MSKLVKRQLLSTNSISNIINNEDGSTTEIIQEGDTTIEKTTKEEEGTITINTVFIDETGDITGKENQVQDPDGNQQTQTIEVNENGEEVVTSYTIDTSENPDGSKTFNGDGVNTEYYAFDVTHGFILDLNFTIDFANQPAGQNENHHNIICMKRNTSTPWYGFQMRQTGTNKYVQLGTQFATGNNSNVTVNAASVSGNVAEYNLRIIYDPTASTKQFIYINMATGAEELTYNNTFPDTEELRYLKVTIGYAMQSNEEPYRFSNINVKNFSIKRLKKVAAPAIICDGKNITLTCETVGATIYYKLNHLGSYVAYTSPITIEEDTFIQAYAELNDETSDVVQQNCEYDTGITTPSITCDGEYVSIACSTTDATIYYRLNEVGSYIEYTDSFLINATTVVEAYAESSGVTSHTAKVTCTYNPVVLNSPIIICNGEQVFITCSTENAVINYRLNQTGSYNVYSTPITIL